MMNYTPHAGAKVADILSLENIRRQLIRLEDTIIFLVIERAQFAHNPKIYEKGAFKDEMDFEGSWLDWFLLETERTCAKARRYTSPDEHPFTPLEQLPKPIITPQKYPALLHEPAAKHPSVNVNHRILDFYVNHLVPGITEVPPGSPRRTANGTVSNPVNPLDDGNYGSAATRDVEALQAISRRIHFGMFVSESKFLAAPHDFIPHILADPPNTDALAGLITKPEVEAKLLVRLANKARVYGCEMDADGRVIPIPDQELGLRGKIDIDEVVRLYRDWIIPLTKDVEVDYLVHRLDGVPQEQIDAWMAGAKANGK
ncbi:putative chorismate mutase [Cutaneotrichosporon oleaginosum]|uniref:Chorismate mutase n=1 Tax=Cutaneotrichosporon oleaginosum TaxID=879819 RepID=A0A0J0XFE6_9TREE|nr:putative chorismate mutase [Cutaneotrichosporon oleaginosum]KLT39815.1 putative chorismate mutase [Cutaneotrichosporon oleaginosum]